MYCQITITSKVGKERGHHKYIIIRSVRPNKEGAEKQAAESGANTYITNGQKISTSWGRPERPEKSIAQNLKMHSNEGKSNQIKPNYLSKTSNILYYQPLQIIHSLIPYNCKYFFR